MTRTINALHACPLSRTEPLRTLRCVGRQAEVFDVAAGRLLLVEGDPSNNLYLVIEGALVVHAHRRHLAYLPTGQIFGEIGVITGHPRSAFVETITQSRIMRIRGSQFRSALNGSSTLQRRTRDLMASRSTAASEAALNGHHQRLSPRPD